MARADWSGPLTDTWPEAKVAERAERERLRSLFTTVSAVGHHSYSEFEVKVVQTEMTCCTLCGALVGIEKRHDEWHRASDG